MARNISGISNVIIESGAIMALSGACARALRVSSALTAHSALYGGT